MFNEANNNIDGWQKWVDDEKQKVAQLEEDRRALVELQGHTS